MSQGVLTLVFDDGYKDVFVHVRPILQKLHMHAVFAVPIQPLPGGLPISDWRAACTAEGHELAAHGMTHRPLTALSDQALEEELQKSKEATGASTLVYPGGAFDDRVQTAAKRFFSAGRTVRWGIESLPSSEPFALQTLNATQKNFRAWKYRPRELLATLTGHWVIETFHNVTSTPRSLHDVALEDFERHLAWLARLPVRIATIREVI